MSSSAAVDASPRRLPADPRDARSVDAGPSDLSDAGGEPEVVTTASPRPRLRLVDGREAGTTTAEYTVVTAAAVAFGALLLKLLTGGWGQRILEVAFRGVIKMLGF